jgi:uncharacterized delta-60 repeat protein
MSNRCRRVLRIVAVECIALGTCRVAGAQSALDGFNPGANNNVFAVAVQPDGKAVVGGDFTTLGGGGTGTSTCSRLGRLNVDGSLDTTFNAGANGTVWALAVQPDGKILVGGAFTTLGGGGTGTTVRNRIGRLNPDGSLDASFDPGADNVVLALVLQPDGKVLVGGMFGALGGGGTGSPTRRFVGRLNADGSLDDGFIPGANNTVWSMAVEPDGQVLLGGLFTALGGGGYGTTNRSHIGRLNSDGSLDSAFDPGTDHEVYALAVQTDGKIVVGGAFTTIGGGGTGTSTRSRIGRLNADGSADATFNPGADVTVWALIVGPDQKILVGGEFNALGGIGGVPTTVRHHVGRLNADGTVDTGFDPGASGEVHSMAVQPDGKIALVGRFTTLGGGGTGTAARNRVGRLYSDGSLDDDLDSGANNYATALAMQPDGKIVVAGAFTTLGGGGTGTAARSFIGRLLPDGTLDTNFDPGSRSLVYAIAVQPDGKILVGGAFSMLGGGGTGTTSRNFLGRLNADGSLDTTFNPGANQIVYAIAVQPDGKILVGGNFTMLGGGGTGTNARIRVGRLNPDGSIDATFNPGASNIVSTMALQADGKILVGGYFTGLGGGTGTTTRNRIGRLNADGSIDTTFDPGANGNVVAMAVQPDGKILVGGAFTGLGGGTGTTTRNRIGRLDVNGLVDSTFDPGANNTVFSLALQTDGGIVVVGGFTMLGGGTGTTPRNCIGRINADGSVDSIFDPGSNGAVMAVALQGDGKVVASGVFTTIGGGGTGITSRNRIARLTNTGAALQTLGVSTAGGMISWARNGKGPEVEQVAFESSTDGTTFTPLGPGTRVAGGWQLTGQSLPLDRSLYIRARGYYDAGYESGSGSVVESVRVVELVRPTVTAVQPASGPVAGGTVVTLTGTHFLAGARVVASKTGYSEFPPANVRVLNDRSLTAVTPVSPAGPGVTDVKVLNPDGFISPTNGLFTYLAPPTVTGVTPSSGPLAGGQTVTVTGQNFQPGILMVTFGAVAAKGIVVTSATSLTAVTPGHPLGPVDVVVTNPDGQAGTLLGGFIYYAAPIVSGVAPNYGPTAGGTAVTIYGQNFRPGMQVAFGGVVATPVQVLDATMATTTTPAKTGGLVDVVVANVDGQTGTRTGGFTYYWPPAPTGVSPSSGPTGGGTAVTITGISFRTGVAVTFGGVVATGVQMVNGTTLTAVTPAHSAGAVDVVVANVDGQTGTLVGGFRYYAAPTVTAVTPASGPALGGTLVTITGTAFRTGAVVAVGGTPATGVQVVSATTITAVTPAHALGTADVAVANDDGQAGLLTGAFRYLGPPPTVASIDPAVGPQRGGTSVTITGTGFVTGARVDIADPATNVVVASSTSITATTAGVCCSLTGVVDVVVTNPDAQSAVLAGGFDYEVPFAYGLSPGVGPTAGGTEVTISGIAFTPGMSVQFGGVSATNVTSVSSKMLTAIIPAHDVGFVDVVVLWPGGLYQYLAGSFAFVAPAPRVASVRPSAGTTGGGTLVTITGTDFTSGTAVAFGSTPAAGALFVNATTVLATTPAHAVGTVDVSVATFGAQVGRLASGYSFVGPLAPFTDDPLQAGVTPVKVVHVSELRQRIGELRARYALTPFAWTDSALAAGTMPVKAMHITDLRAAIVEVYVAAGRSAPTFSRAVTAGRTSIAVVDIAELRTAVAAIW